MERTCRCEAGIMCLTVTELLKDPVDLTKEAAAEGSVCRLLEKHNSLCLSWHRDLGNEDGVRFKPWK